MPYYSQRSVQERQGLGGFLGDLLGDGASTASAATQPTETATQTGGGLLSSLAGGLLPPAHSTSTALSSSTAALTSSTATLSSSSSTLTSTSSSTASSTSTTSTTTTSLSSSTSTSSSSSSGPSSSGSSSSVSLSTSILPDLSTTVVTVNVGPSTTSSSDALGATGNPKNNAALPPSSFLQNKPLAGGVFAAIGIVAAIVIVFLITLSIRRRRRKSLEDEIVDAVSWQPQRHSHHSFADVDSLHHGNPSDNGNYGGEKGDWRTEAGSMNQGYGAQTYGAQPLAPSALYQQPAQQRAAYDGQAQQYPFATPYAVQQYGNAGYVQQPPVQTNAAAQAAAAMALPDRFGQEGGLSRSGTLDRGNDVYGGHLTIANE